MTRPAKNVLALVIYIGVWVGVDRALRGGLGWDAWLSWVLGAVVAAIVLAILQLRGVYARSWRD